MELYEAFAIPAFTFAAISVYSWVKYLNNVSLRGASIDLINSLRLGIISGAGFFISLMGTTISYPYEHFIFGMLVSGAIGFMMGRYIAFVILYANLIFGNTAEEYFEGRER